MDKIKEYNLHNLLKISSNIPGIDSFLHYFRTDKLDSDLAVSITVLSDKDIDVAEFNLKRIGDFAYDQDKDVFFYDHPFFFPAKLLVKGLSSQAVEIRVTPWFLKLPTIFRGGLNFDYIFREIILIKLIELGYVIFHSAGVDINGKGLLFTAFPNTGKTYLSFGLVRENKAKLVSDEYLFVNESLEVKSFFGMSALGPRIIKDFAINISLEERFKLNLCILRAKLLPFLFEANIWVESSRLVQSAKRAISSNLDCILFLARGQDQIRPVDKNKAYQKLLLLTENEFPFVTNYFFQAYAYANDKFDLFGLQTKQRQIINNIVNKVRARLVLAFTPGDINKVADLIIKSL